MDAAKEWVQILGFNAGDPINDELIEKHYRRLVRKYHPDAGGSTEDMQQLNRSRELAHAWIARQKRLRAEMARQIATWEAQMASLNRAMAQSHQQQMNANIAANQSNWMGNMGGLAGMGNVGMANAYHAARSADPPQEAREIPKTESKPKWWSFLQKKRT